MSFSWVLLQLMKGTTIIFLVIGASERDPVALAVGDPSSEGRR